jgi:hypothetical protein
LEVLGFSPGAYRDIERTGRGSATNNRDKGRGGRRQRVRSERTTNRCGVEEQGTASPVVTVDGSDAGGLINESLPGEVRELEKFTDVDGGVDNLADGRVCGSLKVPDLGDGVWSGARYEVGEGTEERW